MASYQQRIYCKNCKAYTTLNDTGSCSICNSTSLNRSWSVRFRIMCLDGEKQKRLTGFSTKKEAEKAYIDFQSKYSITNELKHKDSFIFDDLYKKYISTSELENSHSTVYDKKHLFELFIIPFFKGKDMTKVSKADISTWQDVLWHAKDPKTNQEYSWKYRSKIRGYLYNFLSYLESVYDIPNKLRTIKKPKNKQNQATIVFWQIDEFDRFINTVEDKFWQTVWYCFMFTGARFNELRAFSDNDVGKITNISKSLYGKKASAEMGLASKSSDLEYNEIVKQNTKNYKTVTKQTPEVLQTKIAEYKRYKKENGIASDFLFGGNLPLSEMTIRRRLNQDIDNYNDTHEDQLERITPHGFRHSYVSMLINLGVSTKIVAELIGDTEEVVMKTYGHLYKDVKNNAINLLDKNLKNA